MPLIDLEVGMTEEDDTFVSPVNRQLKEEESNQRDNPFSDLIAGFESTALAGGIRRAGEEGTAALEQYNLDNPLDREVNSYGRPGMTTGQMGAALGGIGKGLIGRSYDSGEEFDKAEHVEALIEGIPSNYHAAIMDEPTLAAAQRARARLLEDFEAARITGMQFDGQVNNLLGSFVDVDAPLMLLSGGMFGAAKAARLAQIATRNRHVTGAVQGISGGAQAGLVVGAYDAIVRESSDEGMLITSILGGAALGGTLGAVGGDMSRSIDATNQDYLKRFAEDDPTITATDTNTLTAAPAEPLVPVVDDFAAGSAGAGQRIPDHVREEYDAAVAAGASDEALRAIAGRDAPTRSETLVDPIDRISPTSARIIDHADETQLLTGAADRKAADKNWLERLSLSSWGAGVGTGFQNRMATSGSVVMNWLGNHVYESASGLNRGEATSAGLMENYHKRIQSHLLPIQSRMSTWAQENGTTAFGSGYGISNNGRAAFYREVMLERNARNHGRTHSADPHIRGAADDLDKAATEALGIGRGRDGEIAIRGMDNVADNPHYTPQQWSGAKLQAMIASGRVTRAEIIAAVAKGYRQSGMAAGKDADAVAEAVIRRAELNNADVDSSVHSLLQADGQEFLRDSLERNGMSAVEVDGIMNRLVGDAADRSKEGFAKSRNEIDMSASIGTTDDLQIVDLLSNDLGGDWQRYTRGLSGSAALARQGIDSKAARREVVTAIHAEQRSLGEDITPAEELMAMFTHFDGGATKGWSKLVGGDPAAAGAGVAGVKRMVQLAWLNKLGLVQLGETGAMMAQNGMASWMRRGPFAYFNAQLKAGNEQLLRDVSFLTGDIGQDHKLFADHLNLDEVSDFDAPDLLSRFNKATSSAAFIQGYTSLFNAVRSSQQQTAALGVMDKVMRTLRDAQQRGEQLDDGTMARMWGDLGLSNDTLMRLNDLIADGTIEFSPEGFVNRLHADKWDSDLQNIVGVSITRNINQVVQKSMAGEQDAWMHTGLGSLLTHLKTFPMQATQKQFVRHFRHNDPEAYAALMFGFGTALTASMIRAQVDGRDMTAEEHAKRAFGYSNMTGFIPMAVDPLMTMMGLDDKRFNQYGPHSEVSVPALSWINDAMRVPGALAKSAAGNADYDDMRAKRALPFANTILIGEMMTSIGQANK
jgi:hypothetical protein